MYLRKSRADIEAEARGEGETLKRHEKILFDLAKKMKINITKIYREIVSGETISARPVMQRLLTDIENGMWEGVFVVEVERLARGDTIDQGIVAQAFKYTNTKIITPMKIYDPNNEFDEEYFEFGLFMSRREYKTINRRLQRGRIESVKEGKYLGTIAPYGYKRKRLEKQKGYTLEIIPNEAKIVKLIYDWYTSSNRIGVSIIARKLNEMKIPTRKGGDWTTSTIRGILSNPVYIGKIRWNSRPQIKQVVNGEIIKKRPRANKKDWILVDGLHEAIIDDDTFNLAQKYLSENPTLPIPTRYVTKNPLAGLIVCGICGRKMNRRPYKNYPDTLMCVGPTCTNVSSHLYLVEKKLLNVLEAWLNNYKLDLASKEKKQESNLEIDIIKKSIKSLDKELETLNKQSNSLHDLLEQGVYSVETFLERSKIINDKINIVKTNKKELEEKLNKIYITEKNKKILIPKIERVIELYWKLKSAKEKNELLKEVIDKAIYIKKEGGRWSDKIDDFTLDLYPKLPE
ncbi:recombinase family protein [Caminicella sporogenes]|uniref:recombinase family protein n=1 Tax=Caminicella sporogenes TaxID=166485 RepID=UPI00253FB624|nr:recombinase family protein [Caminicella sporogenes]WIF96215.1 recombinase family protein [Caminicella sporogenes]